MFIIKFLKEIFFKVCSCFYVGATDILPEPLSKEEEATYASRCIDNEILMYLRKNKKVKSEVSIDQALSLDSDGNELHLEDIIGTPKDEITKSLEKEDDKELMIREILSLKPRDREIMVLRYGLLGNDEFTQKEVAEKLGISQSYISRIEKKVIKKLKLLINN